MSDNGNVTEMVQKVVRSLGGAQSTTTDAGTIQKKSTADDIQIIRLNQEINRPAPFKTFKIIPGGPV